MLENPYYTAQPDIPSEAGAYRGDGRIEASSDGSSITIRWESPLEEAVAAQWELQKKLGSIKAIRRTQIVYGVATVCSFALVGFFGIEPERYRWILLFLGIFMLAMIFVKPFTYRIAVRRLVVKLRGTIGSVESLVTIDPAGVHHESNDMVWTFRWRSVRETEVVKNVVNFVREPAGLIQVPVRVFPDAATLVQFLALAEKYAKQRPV